MTKWIFNNESGLLNVIPLNVKDEGRKTVGFAYFKQIRFFNLIHFFYNLKKTFSQILTNNLATSFQGGCKVNNSKFKRFFAIFMVLAMVVSLIPAVVGAAEADYGNLIISSAVKPSEGGALQLIEVNGQKTLGDASGTPIQLRGMSTHGLQWFPEIINGNAFAALANDWDSNVIRLAMYVGENGYATNPEVIKQRVIDGIDFAIANDMYVIVDWHVHAPGDPNADVYSGALDFFTEISALYPNNPHIIYELANEPSSNSNGGPGITNDEAGWQAVKSYAEPIIDMLRTNGNENIVIVGSPNWSQRPDLAADNPINDANTMYTVHFYTGTHGPSAVSYPEGTPSSERGNVMANARYALEHGAAVFSTEWGTSQASGDGGPYLDEADVWINFLNENNISWVNWSLTNKNETSGAFTPFELGKSDATDLDPGDDQVWSAGELSVSGEYVRARIKGISYEPIDRTREDYSEIVWHFDDGTTQGFGVNADNPVPALSLSNENNTLKLTGLDASNGVSGGDIWSNARIASDAWNPGVDIKGAETITMDVIASEPATVAIAAIPQSSLAEVWWENPTNVTVEADDFVLQDNGTYKALLTVTQVEAPALKSIAESTAGNNLSNLILFVGTAGVNEISLDNITVNGNRAKPVTPPVVHDELGTAALPSDFEDATRQGWGWNAESGVKTALTIEEANGSNALSWEYAYPEVKPSDGWATAPRLELYKSGLVRGDHDFVTFDLYVDPIRATGGAISINLVFQPPAGGYWQQAPETFTIELENLDSAAIVDGLYHYEVSINIRDIAGIADDTELRNMILIFADVESDFAGRLYIDNIQFELPKNSIPMDERQYVNEPTANNGTIVVEVEEGKQQILLPADAAVIDGVNSLTIKGEDGTVVIPAEVLVQLQDLAPGGLEGAYLAITVNGKVVPDQGPGKKADYDYSIQLSFITTEDKENVLESFIAPVELKLKVKGSKNNFDVYLINEIGELEYLGGEGIQGKVVVSITESGTYAVREKK
jgi:endoglucanase